MASKPSAVATNRRARRDFELLDTLEAGIVLTGSEVKSLRGGKAQIAEAYARISRGEAWLLGMHIPPYPQAGTAFSHEPERPRKLLLHRKEIEKLQRSLDTQPLTLIPLSLYFSGKNAKVSLALARRKQKQDKRRLIDERDAAREARGASGKNQ